MSDMVYKATNAGVFKAKKELMPKRKTYGSAGYDFIAPETVTIPANTFVEFDTGVQVQMRRGFVLHLYIRSSLGQKGITLTNGVAVIDSDFRDSMKAMIMNNSATPYTIKKGDRYMQGIFHRYYITDDDTADGERVGGIGSTGR